MKKYFPIILTIIIFNISVFILLILSLKNTNGILIYALDDAYIHMAIAKNFVMHNVFGITKHGFSSATSSPLWTILLSALFFIFNINIKIYY